MQIEVNGQVCAGKMIHETLLGFDPYNGHAMSRPFVSKYVQECHLMSELRHPNIVQFMGVCFLPNSQLPVLVMEKLEDNVDNLIERVSNIPLVLKLSLLEDVAKGLVYLHHHVPPIIHRDLTARNVLLTSNFDAKITDFGNSRIIRRHLFSGYLTQAPGTLVYMAPEALSHHGSYGPSLDIFSFGHLALFAMIQVITIIEGYFCWCE